MTTTVNDIKFLDMVNKNKTNLLEINHNEILLTSIVLTNINKTIKINETIDENIEHIFDKEKIENNNNNNLIKNLHSKSSFFFDYNISRSYSDTNFNKNKNNNKKILKKIPNLPLRKKNGFLFNNQLTRNSVNNSIISNSNINSLENISSSNGDFKKTIKKIKDSYSKSMIKNEDSLNKKLNVKSIFLIFLIFLIFFRMKNLKN